MDHFKNDFLRGYLECALWSSMDESDENGGEPLDANYSIADFSVESLERSLDDCNAFEKANAADLDAFYEIYPTSPDGDTARAFAGHNFWLTRSGHGTGFWDRDAGDAGDRLSEACREFGEVDVYVGDDGQLWMSR